MQLKGKEFEIIMVIIILMVGFAGTFVLLVESKVNADNPRVENGQWTCKIRSSNGFGYCLDDLVVELGLQATYSVQSDDACYYVRQHGGSELWAQMNGDGSEYRKNQLAWAENDAVRAQKNGHFSDASPARQVFESIGMPYNKEFWSWGTVSVDLGQLRNNRESQQKIIDYVNSVFESDSIAINTFYYEDLVNSGLVKRIDMSNKLDIRVVGEGLKSELETRDNVTHVQCKG